MEDFQQPKKQINVFEILEVVRPASAFLKKRWWIVLISMLSLLVLMFWREKSKVKLYEAVNTFILEDELMEQLGGGKGGTDLLSVLQGQNVAKGNKMLLVELSMSYQLIEKTLLHSCRINGQWQSLGNRYIELTGRLKSIASKPEFKGFRPDSSYKFGVNDKHDYLMRTLAKEISPNITSTSKESGIIEHKMLFWDEEFTRVFSSNHIREISEYYAEKRLEKAGQLLSYTGRKMDSLELRLKGQEYGLAQLNDEGFGVVMHRAKVPELNYKRNITLISNQYLEAVTANNMARLEYEKKRPIITLVDDARSPLKCIEGNPVKGAIIGALAGLLLGIVLVIGFYFTRKILSEQKEMYSAQALNK